MNFYLAGPMTGIPEYNFPAFIAAAAKLRDLGNVVFNPAEADLAEWGTIEEVLKKANYRDCLRKDLNYILDKADAIAILPGWESSKGCAAELALAKALKLPIMYL